MKTRLIHAEHSPLLTKKLTELSMLLADSSIDKSILDLINYRASQINGCVFCLDLDVKKFKAHGERELRVYHLPVWKESPLFSDKEKAALLWTDAVTEISKNGIPDGVFIEVRKHFSEKELSDLTYAISAINAWNRLNIAFRTPPGSMDQIFGLDKVDLK